MAALVTACLNRPAAGCSVRRLSSDRGRGRRLRPLLDEMEGLCLEAVGLAVDKRCRLAIGSVDEAEDLAGLLVDPVVLVVDAVGVLDPDVGGVRSDHVAGLHARQIVDIDVCRHWDRLLLLPPFWFVADATRLDTSESRRLDFSVSDAYPFGWTTASTLPLGSMNQAAQEWPMSATPSVVTGSGVVYSSICTPRARRSLSAAWMSGTRHAICVWV